MSRARTLVNPTVVLRDAARQRLAQLVTTVNPGQWNDMADLHDLHFTDNVRNWMHQAGREAA